MPSVTFHRMPSSWWQHLKLSLRERWPRAFRRLIVRWKPAHQAVLFVEDSRARVQEVEAN